MKQVLLLLNAGMALIFLLMGLAFVKSGGKASRFIAGFHTKSKAQQAQFNTARLCRDYGNRMMLWAACFALGFVLDCVFVGAGTATAWGIWTVFFICHVADMTKHESRYKLP